MNLLEELLSRRNPYGDIGSKAQKRVQRRRPEAAQDASDAPEGGARDDTQEAQRNRAVTGSQQTPSSQTPDIYSRVQDAIKNNSRIQNQQRMQAQQANIQNLISASRRQSNYDLDPISPLERAQSQLGGGHDHGPVVRNGENGRLDTSQLVDADERGNLLQPAAASAWQAMVQAAAQDGVTLSIGNSYRTYEQQVHLAQEKGLYSQGGLAASPGTSNHGWGTAVDVGNNPGEREWLAQNGNRFGFHTIAREPWHWEYRG